MGIEGWNVPCVGIGRAVNKNQYLSTLKRLDLPVSGKATLIALGISKRQALRYAAGDSEVHPAVERLLKMYVKFGIPDEFLKSS
jgi:hypothetical protein